ncbi:MAG: 6-phosphogluconolactonase [Actinomycetota bacterium]
MAELIVTDDLPEAVVRLFLETAPRVVALAGGSTPRASYERLAKLDYPWEDVDVIPTDERCVLPAHPDSNFRMLDEALLSKVPARVLWLAGESCDADAHDAEVRELLERLPLDLAILGLGADGHTASLFPGDPALEERERAVVRVDRGDHPRLTLTLAVLSSARVAAFVATGESKRRAVEQLLSGEDIPAARIQAPRVMVVADREAAPQP